MKDIPTYEYIVEASRQIPGLDVMALHSCLTLVSAYDELHKRKDAHFVSEGITRGRFMIMLMLHDLPNLSKFVARTPAELADMVQVTRATITGLLDSLEKDAFVKREPCVNDRRKVYIHLTGAGKKYMKKFLPVHCQLIAELMQGLSKKEQKELVRLLTKLIQGFPSMNAKEN